MILDLTDEPLSRRALPVFLERSAHAFLVVYEVAGIGWSRAKLARSPDGAVEPRELWAARRSGCDRAPEVEGLVLTDPRHYTRTSC